MMNNSAEVLSRLCDAFNAIPNPIFHFQKACDGRIIQICTNQAALDVTKGKACLFNNQDLAELVQDEEIGPILHQIGVDVVEIVRKSRLALESGCTIQIERTYNRCSGNPRIYSLEFIRVSENDILLICRDVTKHRRTEETLKRQNEELSGFSHALAHDLKNNLFKIASYATFLKQNDNTGHAARIIQLVDVTKQLLDHSLALADAGLVIKKTEEVNLTTLIDEEAEAIFPESVSLALDQLPTVICDQVKIKQVFQNLFENAVVHGIATEIEVRLQEDDSRFLLRVKNNGIAIPPEHRLKIFDNGFTTKKGGTGLGLAIVKRLVEAHGWQIVLEDTPQTSFCITVPKDAESERSF
jgi:signal transduction histidine kinase